MALLVVFGKECVRISRDDELAREGSEREDRRGLSAVRVIGGRRRQLSIVPAEHHFDVVGKSEQRQSRLPSLTLFVVGSDFCTSP